jgi:hypothetical protein
MEWIFGLHFGSSGFLENQNDVAQRLTMTNGL